jgi:hypothetical protein
VQEIEKMACALCRAEENDIKLLLNPKGTQRWKDEQ